MRLHLARLKLLPLKLRINARKLGLVGLVIGMLGLSVFIVLLLTQLEHLIRRPLEDFALYAYLLVFIVTLFSSATVFIPAPGIAFMLAAASKWNPAWVALAASLGGTLGEITGYYAGLLGRRIIVRNQWMSSQRAENWMRRWGLWALIPFAFFPFLIFDIVGLIAGALRMPLWKFLLATWLGRLPRALIESYIGGELLRFFFPT
jgi:membrane protein YqaA with SNARE-associated domain